MVTRNDDPPDTNFVDASKLVDSVLALLEEAGAPTELNDSIVAIIEWWERGSHEINYSGGGGFLLVGADPDRGAVIVNLDRDRTGHLTFSPDQARAFATNLIDKASKIDLSPLMCPCSGMYRCNICGGAVRFDGTKPGT
jgi:hypothetical protein